MEKVLLAVGFRELEEFIQKKLKNEFMFVGVTTYRDGVIRQLGQTQPDIIVLRETLLGNENILDIVYEIRTKFHNVRIIFIAKEREPGDALLSTLVSHGVYDIIYGGRVPANEVIRMLRKPNEYKDVQHLQPKPVLDEKKNKVLFETPDVQMVEREVVREVVKEVYIGNDNERTTSQDVNVQLSKSETNNSAFVDENASLKGTVDQGNEEQQEVVQKGLISSNAEVPKEKGSRLQKWFGTKENKEQLTPLQTGKQKIITFMGSKSGVGNTSIALNTAVHLANKNKRILYIEVNDRTPSVNYWFDLGFLDEGIDSALNAFKINDFESIKNAIVFNSDLMERNSDLKHSYLQFPSTLDFMFFSNRYLTRRQGEEVVDLSLTKDLYLYLLFQMEYDYIFLDVSSDLENQATLNALMYSNKIVITVTQDVSVIGNAVYCLNEMYKNGIQTSEKLQVIVNRFEKADLNMKGIEEWMQIKSMLQVPCMNKEFINANFLGLPLVINSKSSQIKDTFGKIEKSII